MRRPDTEHSTFGGGIPVRGALPNSARRGVVVPLTAVLLFILVGMVAFAVDVGYIAVARSEAQNAADAACLAGIGKLAERWKSAPIIQGIPLQTGSDLQLVRAEARAFARRNRVGSQDADLQDADIEIGYLANPHDHGNDTLDQSGWPARPYNAVRVTVRRDQNHAGGPLNLVFAPVVGIQHTNLSATAASAFVLGTVRPRGNHGSYRGGLLPFTYQVDEWNALLAARSPSSVTAANGVTITLADNFTVDPQSTGASGVSSGSDGRLETKLFPNRTTNGNYGTINFSKTKVGNSTNILRDLILNGPNEADWPDLPAIVAASPSGPVDVNGDPGLSVGMEPAVRTIRGQPRILSLYSTVYSQGNNTYYRIVGFTPVTIVEVYFQGEKYSHITVQPRVTALKSLVVGANRIYFDVTPRANPDPLFLGARGLVR